MAVDTIARGIAAGRVPITAYDMAVAGGYVGTKEEFEADMGNSGTNATNAANSAAAAAASAAEASAVADDIAQYKTDTMTAPANITAGEYVLAAGTLYVATANIASGSTLTPNGNVKQVTVGGELTDVIASDANKADNNGNYPNMTVGNALQLVSTVGVEDQVPYNFRTSGGAADIGDRETDMVVGGTVAWNQLFPLRNLSYTSDNLDVSSASDGKWVATIRGASSGANITAVSLGAAKYANHKMLLVSGSDTVQVVLKTPNNRISPIVFNYDSSWTGAYTNVTVRYADETTGTFELYPMLIDLTQMFGATIADYIYSLEQANAGDGVAWFRKLFPNAYYATDDGTLRSVQTSAHRMIGFNAWDEEWEVGRIAASGNNTSSSTQIRSKNYIPVISGTTYYFKSPNGIFCWGYDSNKGFVSRVPDGNRIMGIFAVPENVMYLRFATPEGYGNTYHNDICLNLSWDGERDGEYEPYVEHTYPLDDSLTLRGIPKLDANNKLRYDGDTYASDGTVTRRCAEQTFVGASGESWSIYGFTTEMPRYAFKIIPAIPRNKSLPVTELVAIGVEVSASNAADVGAAATTISCRFGVNANDFYISIPRSQFSGETLQEVVAEFKIWLASNPVSITYERETYVTESAAPYTNPQIVSDWGTEEYVDAGVEAGARDVVIPVGHETFYQANLRAKLEAAPNSPSSGDGLYAVRQTNGANAYELLVFPDELPPYPSADGTFVLKVTVADGTPTLAWVSE